MVKLDDQNRDTENIILSAAESVFHEFGYAGSRMQQIADKAGVNKALLHYYFRSKEQLFGKIFIKQFNTFISVMLPMLDEEMDFFSRLDFIIDGYMTILKSNPDLALLIVTTINFQPSFVKDIDNRVGIKMKKIIQAEIEKGNIIETHPMHVMTSVIGLCVMPYLMKPMAMHMFKGKPSDFQTIIVERADFVKRAVRKIFKSKTK